MQDESSCVVAENKNIDQDPDVLWKLLRLRLRGRAGISCWRTECMETGHTGLVTLALHFVQGDLKHKGLGVQLSAAALRCSSLLAGHGRQTDAKQRSASPLS